MSHSEIASIREQIDLEIEAMNRIMKEPAVVANHQAVTARLQRIWGYKEQLDKHIPADEVAEIVAPALEGIEQLPSRQL